MLYTLKVEEFESGKGQLFCVAEAPDVPAAVLGAGLILELCKGGRMNLVDARAKVERLGAGAVAAALMQVLFEERVLN